MSGDDDFGDAFARGSDPDPSHDAAARVSPVANRLESIVLQVLRDHGTWMSVLALEVQLKPHGIDKWSISPRMARLEEKGFAERKVMPGLNSSQKIRDLTHWRVRLHRSPEIDVIKTPALAPAPKQPSAAWCRLCGESGGFIQQATYVGAPEGGVPVHQKCLPAFYQAIDQTKHRY